MSILLICNFLNFKIFSFLQLIFPHPFAREFAAEGVARLEGRIALEQFGCPLKNPTQGAPSQNGLRTHGQRGQRHGEQFTQGRQVVVPGPARDDQALEAVEFGMDPGHHLPGEKLNIN